MPMKFSTEPIEALSPHVSDAHHRTGISKGLEGRSRTPLGWRPKLLIEKAAPRRSQCSYHPG